MSGTLPTWMEHWLGLADKPGMGTAWRLEGQWPPGDLGDAAGSRRIAGDRRLRLSSARAHQDQPATISSCCLPYDLCQIALGAGDGGTSSRLLLQRTGLPVRHRDVGRSAKSMNTVDRYDDALRRSRKLA